MVPPTGPTRLALFLLCCTGVWLAVHPVPTGDRLCQIIVRELKGLSEQILEVQKEEVGLPSRRYPLPPLAHCCQPRRTNDSAILPYVKAIEPFVTKSSVIKKAVEQLDKIKDLCELSADVPVPTLSPKSLEHKWFISTVLQELSSNLNSL